MSWGKKQIRKLNIKKIKNIKTQFYIYFVKGLGVNLMVYLPFTERSKHRRLFRMDSWDLEKASRICSLGY